MAIKGVIYSNQKVSAQDHAALFQMLISDGIIYGCGSSSRLNVFTVSAGSFIAAGRLTRIVGSESVTISTTQSNVFARIKGVCDMTQVATRKDFYQFRFEVEYAATVDGFPSLVRENINTDGETYEFEWAILTIGETGIITNIDVKIGQSHSGGTGGGVTEDLFASYGTSGVDYVFASSGDNWEVAFLTSNANFHLDRALENVDIFMISAGENGGNSRTSGTSTYAEAWGGDGGDGGDYISSIGTTIPFGDYNVKIGQSGDKVTSIGSLFTTDPQHSPSAAHKEGGAAGHVAPSYSTSAIDRYPAGNGEDGVLAWNDPNTLIYPNRIYGSSSGGGNGTSLYSNAPGTSSVGSSGTNAGVSKNKNQNGEDGVANTGSAGGAAGSTVGTGSSWQTAAGGDGGSGIILIRNHVEASA